MWFFQIALLHIPHPTSDSLAADLSLQRIVFSKIKELVENIWGLWYFTQPLQTGVLCGSSPSADQFANLNFCLHFVSFKLLSFISRPTRTFRGFCFFQPRKAAAGGAGVHKRPVWRFWDWDEPCHRTLQSSTRNCVIGHFKVQGGHF